MADLEGVNGQRKEFSVVGKPHLPGKLSPALAAGAAKFGIDYVVPGMLHAKFLRSPYANAQVLSVDTSKARAVPGVVDIVTWEDEDVKQLGAGQNNTYMAGALLDNFADQEGAEVAIIVVAENEDICEEALRALDVKWEVFPHVVDLLEGRKPDAPVVRAMYPSSKPGAATTVGVKSKAKPQKQGNVSYSNVLQGDIEAGFKQADHIIEYELTLPPLSSHIPNPSGSVAWWGIDPYLGSEECLHIEGAVRERPGLSALYGMPLEKTIQQGLFQGGKYCDWGLRKSQRITPLLAKRTGRPVRCVYRRDEMYDFQMKQRIMRMRVGFKNDGLITAIDDLSIADGGVRGSSNFGTTGDQGYGPYVTTKCLNIRQNMDIVDTNRGMMYLSGVHCPFNWDSITMAIHLIAEKLNKDPIDIATLNLHGPDSQEDTRPVPSYEACVASGKKMMNWSWHAAGAKKLPDGRLHGASFRYQMSPRHSGRNYQCKLEFRNGVVRMPTQGPCTGIYAVECNAMVVAEEVGIPYEDLSIEFDYREIFTPVGGGSDGVTASAWVTKECANILKKRILEAVIAEAGNPLLPGRLQTEIPPSPFKGLKPEDLDIKNGNVFAISDPSKNVPLAQAALSHVVATYSGRPPLALWNTGRGTQFDTMNIAMCEVAVDAETGEAEILRFVVAADTGKIMRRTSLESQIDQGMFFSQGCQLFEDYFYDKATGVKLNTNMFDYKKPTLNDFAKVDMELLETRAGNAAYGGNGISHSLSNTHLVICAIQNAIGKWIDPPATPDKVLKALGKA
ncbi:MAG: molybdopterin-dependent oxidoreductase, partial [Acidobacteriota bacterium]|jgi:CO/xanthine dehydrogenase Mo-binding subunit|nr:molybdopterin-dependent oxidoreductase [Acidobacteriota bacterium]